MSKKNSVLAVIPARGGSKGLPGKNLRPLHGKPLIAWTIEAAKHTACIERLILSSDDPETIGVCRGLGCEVPFQRPDELATDEALLSDTLTHALTAFNHGCEYLAVLQPTSPLRRSEDIDGCFNLWIETAAMTCLSVTSAPKPPYWMFSVDGEHRMTPVMGWEMVNTPRHDLPPIYVLNGAVYIVKIDWYLQHKTLLDASTRAYLMPPERSVDIDTLADFQQAEQLMCMANSPETD